jgi:hypothetical protein
MKKNLKKARQISTARVQPQPEQSVIRKAISAGGGEDIDIKKLLTRDYARQKAAWRDAGASPVYGADSAYTGNPLKSGNTKSYFSDPASLETNYYGVVRTISPLYGRQISYRILRRVSEKAWILNLCILHLIKKVRPFLKQSTGENQRGFRIKLKNADKDRAMSAAENKTAKALEDFFLKTGDVEDEDREDDLDKYATRIIRDLCQLDQISTELQLTRGGKLCAFWAVDTATIEIALPESRRATGIKYAQVINSLPYAYYSKDELIFDCMNPRTDIEKAGYGYSIVEQAIDLVTSSINTFMYNAGFFTENRLPRGLLLLNGDADTEEIEDIEDYIINLMSGPPSSQWKVPIIPSGKQKGGEGGRVFEWVNLQGTNKEMEFGSWFDLQLSAIVAMFTLSLEELGLHSQKSQTLFGENVAPKIEASKSISLGDILGFLQKHFNKILAYKNPAYAFEFVGYEKDDLKAALDIDKGETESYKSLNEKRAEKGLDPIDFEKIENPADLPINPYTVQLYQSKQQSGGMGDSPFGGDMGEEENGEGGDFGAETEANDESDNAGDGSIWDDVEDDAGLKKSLGAGRGAVRIVI